MIPKGFMLKDSNLHKNREGILMWIGGRKDIRRMSSIGKWDWERWTCLSTSKFLFMGRLVGGLNILWNGHCKQYGWMVFVGGRSRWHLGWDSRSMVEKNGLKSRPPLQAH